MYMVKFVVKIITGTLLAIATGVLGAIGAAWVLDLVGVTDNSLSNMVNLLGRIVELLEEGIERIPE